MRAHDDKPLLSDRTPGTYRTLPKTPAFTRIRVHILHESELNVTCAGVYVRY